MSFFGKLCGLVVAGGAAFATVKVVKKYQENKAIDQLGSDSGEIPCKKETGEVISDVARAATDVIHETGEKVKVKINDVKEKIVSCECYDCCDEEEVDEDVEEEEQSECGCECDESDAVAEDAEASEEANPTDEK